MRYFGILDIYAHLQFICAFKRNKEERLRIGSLNFNTKHVCFRTGGTIYSYDNQINYSKTKTNFSFLKFQRLAISIDKP